MNFFPLIFGLLLWGSPLPAQDRGEAENFLAPQDFLGGQDWARLGYVYAQEGQRSQALLAYELARELRGRRGEWEDIFSSLGGQPLEASPWDWFLWGGILLGGAYPLWGLFFMLLLGALVLAVFYSRGKRSFKGKTLGLLGLSALMGISLLTWESRPPLGVSLELSPLRPGPSRAYDPQGSLAPQSSLRVLDEQGGFYLIKRGKVGGWVEKGKILTREELLLPSDPLSLW